MNSLNYDRFEKTLILYGSMLLARRAALVPSIWLMYKIMSLLGS